MISNGRSNRNLSRCKERDKSLISMTLSRPTPEPMAQPQPVAAETPDSALITAWREGDERAAAELVRRHARALARFLAGAGAPERDVDDLVQDTFIRAFRGLARVRGQWHFLTWVVTIGG